MSKHGLNLCVCGVHVPSKHEASHIYGSKHKERMKRKAKGKMPLPTKHKRRKNHGKNKGFLLR